ncbi:MAG: LPS export ABC transporter periplasmic protein LptC [Bacteroidetes bacterium]|nr:LPS export ABC transporter periplasmic protein LptC [Bacteroidota bacterium]
MRLILILILPVLIISCSNRDTEKYRSKKLDAAASREVADNVTIEYTDSGFLKAKVKSPQMVAVKQVKNPFVEMTKGVRVDFFREDGMIESYLTAEYAISYTEKKKIIVRQNVEVLNVKGDTMTTEELVWNQATQRITTDKFVTIRTKTQTIFGYGMESDQSFNDWEIGNVKGTINKSNSGND